MVYSTFDWGIRDADGYFFILGRTDDVINVAGHRLGTREIEEHLGAPQYCRSSGGGTVTSQRQVAGGLCCRQGCQPARADAAACSQPGGGRLRR
jgi:acyl-CoA synthetase (AMP-forming)/AMP-acid ligase II